MAKDFSKAFYHSGAWQTCRAAYIAKRIMADGGTCEVCGEAPGYIVHHIIPLTPANVNDAEVALNHSNMRYECKDCHDREEVHCFVGSRRKSKKTLCAFDENGQPIPPVEKN